MRDIPYNKCGDIKHWVNAHIFNVIYYTFMLSQEKSFLCTPLGTKENRYKVFSATVKVRGVLLCCNCCFSHYKPFQTFLMYPAYTYFSILQVGIYFIHPSLLESKFLRVTFA